MTDTRQNLPGPQARQPGGQENIEVVLAPRATRVASYVIIGGVLTQAAIAGGFLAGHPWNDLHMLVGIPLVVSALLLSGIGLIGRRRARTESKSTLVTRLGVFLAILITPIIGIVAADGTRDLLMLHIPLAIVSMGLATRLAWPVR